jgi:hypothetical protein
MWIAPGRPTATNPCGAAFSLLSHSALVHAFETELRAWVPRSQCEHCGVQTIGVSWAGKHPPFIWMFAVFGAAVA